MKRAVDDIETHLNRRTFSGVSVCVSQRGHVCWDAGFGFTAHAETSAVRAPVNCHTVFDFASVTKAASTAVLSHLAVEEDRVRFDELVPRDLSVSGASLRQLLSHSSGLPAWERVYEQALLLDDPTPFARERFSSIGADPARIGTQTYSDVGFIALGRWLERIFDAPLREVFAERIAKPIGLERTGFGDSRSAIAPMECVAATENNGRNGEFKQGIVHDENCESLGGACGHAGLFGSANDLDKLARSLLGYEPRILSPAAVETMWSRSGIPAQWSFGLGWDSPSGATSSAGNLMSRAHTVGHLGFTGTSLWIDREKQVSIALLTNRVHPTRDNPTIRDFRIAIHNSIMTELGYAE